MCLVVPIFIEAWATSNDAVTFLKTLDLLVNAPFRVRQSIALTSARRLPEDLCLKKLVTSLWHRASTLLRGSEQRKQVHPLFFERLQPP